MWPFTRKKIEPPPVWVRVPRLTTPEQDDEIDFPDITIIENLNGVSWEDAPLPPVFHRCTQQTRGWHKLHPIGRCACGGIQNDNGSWRNKNDRRKIERLYRRL